MIILSGSSSTSCREHPPLPDESFRKITPVKPAFQWINFGQVKPRGWILDQMRHDLQEGFLGRLDQLVPDLIVQDSIYGKDRLTRLVKSKDLGTISLDQEWDIQYLWWNSETQSNWWDGLVRTAILTGDTGYFDKVRTHIADMLRTQDDDGYLGIYAPDLRYNFTGENGELWAQSTLFRYLLAWHEAGGDPEVLGAIERAMKRTMEAWPIYQSAPFKVEKAYAGVGHGLTITDALDRLYELTGDRTYHDYALWLYEDYNKHELPEEDIQVKNLFDPEYRFKGHGVHTYEHMRALLTAYYASGNPVLKKALDAYLDKLSSCLTPGGGPIGDEWVAGRNADATETGYEYCSIQELLDSYSHLLQKTGNLEWADRMEWLLYNGGQGARHPFEPAIAYCKTDNSFSMTGALHPVKPSAGRQADTRYKYSPAHQDIAVCCVPNAGRIYPYFVKAMWMNDGNDLVATLYGPCEVTTTIKGVTVRISEDTAYPFDDEVLLVISTDKPIMFRISLRKPGWSNDFILKAGSAKIQETKDCLTLEKKWENGDRISLRFFPGIISHEDLQGEHYLSRGPMVYALPLQGREKVSRQYGLDRFRDLYYYPGKQSYGNLAYQDSLLAGFRFNRGEPGEPDPWINNLSITGYMVNQVTGEQQEVTMVPMGGTILRQVTFKKVNSEQ